MEIGLRDPKNAPLQRLQINKGCIREGDLHESVFDIACRGLSQPDPLNHRFADNGATVDLKIWLVDSEKNACEQATALRDPTYNPRVSGLYAACVVEKPPRR